MLVHSAPSCSMSLLRSDARRDGNEPEVIYALEQMGVYVYRLSQAGIPDLLCFAPRRGKRLAQCFLVEVKNGKRGKIQPKQKAFLELAEFKGWPVRVVSSVDQVLDMYNEVTR